MSQQGSTNVTAPFKSKKKQSFTTSFLNNGGIAALDDNKCIGSYLSKLLRFCQFFIRGKIV